MISLTTMLIDIVFLDFFEYFKIRKIVLEAKLIEKYTFSWRVKFIFC